MEELLGASSALILCGRRSRGSPGLRTTLCLLCWEMGACGPESPDAPCLDPHPWCPCAVPSGGRHPARRLREGRPPPLPESWVKAWPFQGSRPKGHTSLLPGGRQHATVLYHVIHASGWPWSQVIWCRASPLNLETGLPNHRAWQTGRVWEAGDSSCLFPVNSFVIQMLFLKRRSEFCMLL